MSSPQIDLYTASTPNGWKVSVVLEEVGLPYNVHKINLGAGDQKKPEFLAICPNGRIPAIVDHGNGDFAVFETTWRISLEHKCVGCRRQQKFGRVRVIPILGADSIINTCGVRLKRSWSSSMAALFFAG